MTDFRLPYEANAYFKQITTNQILTQDQGLVNNNGKENPPLLFTALT